jgi:hypothetical protein
VVEVWQEKFVVIADPGGVEYDAGQIDELMAARFKEQAAETICPHFETPGGEA